MKLTLLLALALVAWSSPLQGEEFTVCSSGCDFTRIQDAVFAASSGDIIRVQYGVYEESVIIDRDLSIIGERTHGTIIDAAGMGDAVRVLEFIEVSIMNLTLAGGSGSGLVNAGVTRLDKCEVTQNAVRGITNEDDAVLTVEGSRVIENGDSSPGGGIFNGESSVLTVENCVIAKNRGSVGGGIYNSLFGDIEIRWTTLSHNVASSCGGGIWTPCDSDLSLEGCSLRKNRADTGCGGGLASPEDARLQIEECEFVENVAALRGGAIALGGSVSLRRCLVHGNCAESGGGIFVQVFDPAPGRIELIECEVSENKAMQSGGGMFMRVVDSNGRLISNASTFHNNVAEFGSGGALSLSDSINAFFINSTLTLNRAMISGGGVYANILSSLNFEHSTLSHNASMSGASVFLGSGSGVLNHTIISNALEGMECGGLTLESSGYNIIGDSSCPLNGVGDQVGVDPRLGKLGDNGGPTPTRLLLKSSPAIDAIPIDACNLMIDQRGEPRPSGSGCDIGSVEVQNCARALNSSKPTH